MTVLDTTCTGEADGQRQGRTPRVRPLSPPQHLTTVSVLYAVWSQQCEQLLTYGGRIITHTVPPELEFLWPADHRLGPRVVPLPKGVHPDECIPVRCVPFRKAEKR